MLSFSTAQRAAWLATISGSNTAQAIIRAPSKLGYDTYQIPSFSMQIGSGVADTANGGQVPANGEIDVTGIDDLPGANNKRAVIAVTFKLEWESGLTPGAGNLLMGVLAGFRFQQPPFTDDSEFWEISGARCLFQDGALGIGVLTRTPGGFGGIRGITLEDYETYNNQWLTWIFAMAEDSSPFSNYAPGTSTGTYYTRTCLYLTETQQFLQKQDQRFTPAGTAGFVPFLDYNATGNVIGTDGSAEASDNIGLGSNVTGDQFELEPVRTGGIWASFGQTFDPRSVPDTSVFTTRPSSTLGDVEAWINIQMVEANTGDEYQVLDQGAARYSDSTNNYAWIWDSNMGNVTTEYSTTDIPHDRNI